MEHSNKVDPALFGLSSRLVLEVDTNNRITLVMKRKSRIIMKDGERILKIKNTVIKKGGYSSFILKTNAPICSKTRKFLQREGIPIKEISTTTGI